MNALLICSFVVLSVVAGGDLGQTRAVLVCGPTHRPQELTGQMVCAHPITVIRAGHVTLECPLDGLRRR